MTWLQSLANLDVSDWRLVGHKAHYLGLLKRQGLPVVDGWVLTAAAWHSSLAQMPWPPPEGDRLSGLESASYRELQQVSQRWQRSLAATTAPAGLTAPEPGPWPDCLSLAVPPQAPWLLRASLWIDGPGGAAATAAIGTGPGDGLLPADFGPDLATLVQRLPNFWSQALTARCLRVWSTHCRRLGDVSLATLTMPVYPALASGTLTLTQEQVSIAAVAGLGLALSRGEAIPARWQGTLGALAAGGWEDGFQEQFYRLQVGSPAPTPPAIARSVPPPPPALWSQAPLQVVPRDRPQLAAPLTAGQLDALIELGTAAQQQLGSAGVQLEWLLYEARGGLAPQLVITQATPLEGPPPPRVAGAQLAPAGKPPRDQVPAALLPAASTVVQGIGAAAGRQQGIAVVARQPRDLPRPLPPGCIVVLPDLQPDVFLQLESVAGIVTEQGGATCHAAILARELGIPAVVGAPQATQLIDDGMVLWLDGDRGVVYGLTAEALGKPAVQAAMAISTAGETAPLAVSQRDRYRQLATRVMVNLSQTRRLASLPFDLIDGIGLLRSEWLLLDVLEGRHPWDWVNRGQEAELQHRLVQQLTPIVAALDGKPLRYRSLDLRSHEWQALDGSPPVEPNPMLGLRGTLSYNVDSRLFQVELGALAALQRAGHDNLQLILPFVRTVEEVLACRQPIEQAGLTDSPGFALWIMAEVPSVLFLLPAYAAAGIQGIAIGSNDLTQLLLAADRDQPVIASAYDERHPVVRMALAHLVKEARRCGLKCSICGQAPVRYPELIADLVAWGISSISVEAAALPFTLEAVWRAENRELAET